MLTYNFLTIIDFCTWLARIRSELLMLQVKRVGNVNHYLWNIALNMLRWWWVHKSWVLRENWKNCLKLLLHYEMDQNTRSIEPYCNFLKAEAWTLLKFRVSCQPDSKNWKSDEKMDFTNLKNQMQTYLDFKIFFKYENYPAKLCLRVSL